MTQLDAPLPPPTADNEGSICVTGGRMCDVGDVDLGQASWGSNFRG